MLGQIFIFFIILFCISQIKKQNKYFQSMFHFTCSKSPLDLELPLYHINEKMRQKLFNISFNFHLYCGMRNSFLQFYLTNFDTVLLVF